MAARLALFRAKRRTKTIDLPMSHARSFKIKLARLSEIDRIAEVVDLKQRLSALASRRRKNRRIDQHIPTIVVGVLHSTGDRRWGDYTVQKVIELVGQGNQIITDVLADECNAVLREWDARQGRG